VFHQQCVNDPDVWWHLRTGEWILQHRAIPVVDPFSTMSKAPWEAYSWAFELLMYFLYRHFGLLGIVIYTSSMVVAITAVLYRFLQRLQSDFTKAILLTLGATVGIGRLFTPRPWLLTVLFFVIELDILLGAYGEGEDRPNKRALLWLPLIFAVWANLHIQFIDGLVVLLIAAIVPLLRSALSRDASLAGAFVERAGGDRTWREVSERLGIFGACVLATLFNPYGWKIYVAAWQLASQPGVVNKINELQAIPFRDAGDYLVLVIAIAAAIALFRKRHFDLFEGCLLATAIVISFRSQRDVWMVVIVGVGILAEAISARETAEGDTGRERVIALVAWPAVGFAALLVVGLAGTVMRIDNRRLETILEDSMPIRAIDFAKTQQYAGPLYNTYNWGGILIWELRLPVSMDGRAALYGDQRIDRSVATWGGRPGWESDPELARSSLVVAPVDEPLTQLLSMSPHFHLAYKDKMAAVFVRNVQSQTVSEAQSSRVGVIGHQ
jgi:hypothetical protein